MNSVDPQVTLTWIPEGKHEGRGWEGRGGGGGVEEGCKESFGYDEWPPA